MTRSLPVLATPTRYEYNETFDLNLFPIARRNYFKPQKNCPIILLPKFFHVLVSLCPFFS